MDALPWMIPIDDSHGSHTQQGLPGLTSAWPGWPTGPSCTHSPDLSVKGHSLTLHCSPMTFSHYFILLLVFPFFPEPWGFFGSFRAMVAQAVCGKVNHITGLVLPTYPFIPFHLNCASTMQTKHQLQVPPAAGNNEKQHARLGKQKRMLSPILASPFLGQSLESVQMCCSLSLQ